MLITTIDAVADLLNVALGLHSLRRNQVILPAADLRQDCAGAETLLIQFHLLQNLAHERQLIGAVIDDPIALITDGIHFDAQHAGADGVKGADGQPAKRTALAQDRRREPVTNELDNALGHLSGSPVGEGNGQDVPRRDLVFLDQMGDAPGEHARLAGAGACQHQHRTLSGLDGRLLLGIQFIENFGHSERCVLVTGYRKGRGRRLTDGPPGGIGGAIIDHHSSS